MYRLVLHRRAVRYLRKLPVDRKTRIQQQLRKLRENPDTATGTKPMHGEWHGYRRLRIGDLRVIYFSDHGDRVVYVELIAPRGGAYR